MHPRNPYNFGIDFEDLAKHHESLELYLSSEDTSRPHRRTIDFRNGAAQRELTKAILKRDFDANIDLPSDRLCPPVPNRLNYVLWIRDIIASWQTSGGSLCESPQSKDHKICGIDIGTGASAIYPILACRLESEWEMFATEIDLHSLSFAKSNIENNQLQDQIHVLEAGSTADAKLLGPIFDHPSRTFDFTMCNPPFYSSKAEIEQSQEGKDELPSQACTGSEVEMVYSPLSTAVQAFEREGGEVGFVGRMVQESLQLRDQCRWYTSMLGKLSSIPKIVAILKEHDVSNYAVTEFVQGQTRRWAVGWSFGEWRLPDAIGRLSHLPPSHPLQRIQPARTTLEIPLSLSSPIADALQTVYTALQDTLSILLSQSFLVTETPSPTQASSITSLHGTVPILVVRARGNTWSRSARRKRKRDTEDNSGATAKRERVHRNPPQNNIQPPSPTVSSGRQIQDGQRDEKNWPLICSIQIVSRPDVGGTKLSAEAPTETHRAQSRHEVAGVGLIFQWVYGRDKDMFDSFVSHIRNRIQTSFGV